MFSATVRSSHVEELRGQLAAKQQEAARLSQAYVQLQSRASPVRPRPTVELVELAPAEPDRRDRFWGEFLKSNIHRDRVDVVRSLVRNRPYLLQFKDIHRGMTAREYATSLGRTEVLRVLDELEGAVEKRVPEEN